MFYIFFTPGQGVNALWKAFEINLNSISQTTSGGGVGGIPAETG